MRQPLPLLCTTSRQLALNGRPEKDWSRVSSAPPFEGWIDFSTRVWVNTLMVQSYMGARDAPCLALAPIRTGATLSTPLAMPLELEEGGRGYRVAEHGNLRQCTSSWSSALSMSRLAMLAGCLHL